VPHHTDVPVGFEDALSPFGPCIFDGYCGEPIAWGYKITMGKPQGQSPFLPKRGGHADAIQNPPITNIADSV
jgi:hypothetical protein